MKHARARYKYKKYREAFYEYLVEEIETLENHNHFIFSIDKSDYHIKIDDFLFMSYELIYTEPTEKIHNFKTTTIRFQNKNKLLLWLRINIIKGKGGEIGIFK